MKKQYIRPLVEAQSMESAHSIMTTSIELPPDMAPKRNTEPEVF